MPPNHWLPFSVRTGSKIQKLLSLQTNTLQRTWPCGCHQSWLFLIPWQLLTQLTTTVSSCPSSPFLEWLAQHGSDLRLTWRGTHIRWHGENLHLLLTDSPVSVCKGSVLSPSLFTPCTYSPRWCNTTITASTELCWWHLTDPFHPTNRLIIISWLVRQAPHESQLII